MSRQRLGQHFLIRSGILERIAAAACPTTQPLVIEIGPGRGALTAKLIERADRIVAIEVDPLLAAHLRGKYSQDPRLEVVEADILATELVQWMPAVIAGNLPYYITSPILTKVASVAFQRAVFLMQKEVANRVTAKPGSRDYGYLSVQTATFAVPRQLFDVKPGAFQPPPKVDSAVVLLEPRAAPVANVDGFLQFVGRCFQHKRKTIRNNLAPTYGPTVDAWPEAGMRAEQLSLPQFVEMFERIS